MSTVSVTCEDDKGNAKVDVSRLQANVDSVIGVETDGVVAVGSTSLDEVVDVGNSERHDDIYVALVDADMDKQAEHYLHCGRERYMLECCACGHQHVVKEHCKLRVCSHCGVVRMLSLNDSYSGYVDSLPSDRLRLITLTLVNVADLAAGVAKIRKCFTRLRHRKIGRGMFGGIYGIEAVPNGDGLWHVHLHALVEGLYILHKRLSKAWFSVTGDSYIVLIQKVEGGAKSAVMYVGKYVAKGVDMDNTNWTPALLVEFVSALMDVRLIQAFGTFLGKKVERPPFACPKCGGGIFRLVDLQTGDVVFDAFALEWDRWQRSKFFTPNYHEYRL